MLMRRVLFIAYLYPPIANSGTRRSLEFVNHLPDHGWEPIVLTVAEPPPRVCDPTLLDEVRAGTRIERVPLWSDAFAGRIARFIAPRSIRDRVAAGLAWRVRRLLQVPDETAAWYPLAVRRGIEIHREVGFDVIYASGWPWTSFLIARAIARETKRPYVLDYRDTWKPTGTHKWEVQSWPQRLFNPWIERTAARDAAELVSVTPSCASLIGETTGRYRVNCITNGFNPADFIGSSSVRSAGDDAVVRVVYTGVWRPGYGLEDLYQAVRRLKDAGAPCLRNLRVTGAGFVPGYARDFGVEDVVDESGMVPHAEAIALMTASTVLYLPVPEGHYATACLPGKLFEYLGSQRPILASVPSNSEVARVLDTVGGAMRIEPGNISGLATALERLSCGDDADLFSKRRPEELKRYTRASTAKMLGEVLDTVARNAY